MTAVHRVPQQLAAHQPIYHSLRINQDQYVVLVSEDLLHVKYKDKFASIHTGDSVRFFHWSAMRMLEGRLDQICILPCRGETKVILQVNNFYLEPTEVVPKDWEELEDAVRSVYERYFL
jgi:hypothetical protein